MNMTVKTLISLLQKIEDKNAEIEVWDRLSCRCFPIYMVMESRGKVLIESEFEEEVNV